MTISDKRMKDGMRIMASKRERGTGAIVALPNGRFKATLVSNEDDPLEGRKRRVSANGRTRSEANGRNENSTT